jgi:hypothetical protein
MELRQLERLHGYFGVRINRVLSGESPSLHIVSGEVSLRTQAMDGMIVRLYSSVQHGSVL